jgi:hypothetical protein
LICNSVVYSTRNADLCVIFVIKFLSADSQVEWFEGNFEDYEKDKIRRLGPDSVNPKRVTYKRLTR